MKCTKDDREVVDDESTKRLIKEEIEKRFEQSELETKVLLKELHLKIDVLESVIKKQDSERRSMKGVLEDKQDQIGSYERN